jgi:hypothetical protein
MGRMSELHAIIDSSVTVMRMSCIPENVIKANIIKQYGDLGKDFAKDNLDLDEPPLEISDGYWWVNSGADDYVAKVTGNWVFMFGDDTWFIKDKFNFVRKCV